MLGLISKYWGHPPVGTIECYVVKDLTAWPQGTLPADGDAKIRQGARVTVVETLHQGSKTVVIRTVDTNADRAVTSADAVGTADLNYNGVAGDTTDVRLVNNHIGHKAQLFWAAPEFVSACPAGDSVVAGRPSRLRVQVWYRDNGFFPKNHVPQDSFVVTTSVVSGNVRVDEAVQTFAGD
jgi:hypothetical protein